MVKTRIVKGRKQSYVPKTTRRLKAGKATMVGTGGFWRDNRVGKKTIVGKKPVKLLPVYDEYHQFKGWRKVKG